MQYLKLRTVLPAVCGAVISSTTLAAVVYHFTAAEMILVVAADALILCLTVAFLRLSWNEEQLKIAKAVTEKVAEKVEGYVKHAEEKLRRKLECELKAEAFSAAVSILYNGNTGATEPQLKSLMLRFNQMSGALLTAHYPAPFQAEVTKWFNTYVFEGGKFLELNAKRMQTAYVEWQSIRKQIKRFTDNLK